MINTIEQLLLQKTENKQSKIFYTQWLLAKEYIPQILNTISHTFPHYSLHDKSHSDTIINNIVRIIGVETINKFSAVDLWLLLNAAYFHDIGMSVLGCDKTEIFQSEDFADFVKSIKDNAKSPLHKHSQSFEIKEKKVFLINHELNAVSYESSRFLLAEFIRKIHSKRSKKSIYDNESMNLPGAPIPKRLIELLGKICDSHTQSFNDIMQLPFCQTGIDTEDCHPRYIACLLRLGDLLDMDSNRFSTILLQTLSSIPIDSLMHKDKALSITHIRIDNKKIEATAICKDYKVADITNKWFTLLDDEMSDQMKKWNDIVPDSSFGFLPTLGELKVELEDYDTIDGKLRPKFEIDPIKSIELLQGAGIYSNPFQSIRELLQNSTDATYLRIFAENEMSKIENNRTQFINDCHDHPIKIDIAEISNDNGVIKWMITITDEGIGMSKEDLQYLTKTGSSSTNVDKKKMIDKMPEWMKPSGTFGIGFQSVFLITQQVNIVTRKFNKEDAFHIELHNPIGNEEGAILVKTDRSGEVKTGTTISFIFESKRGRIFFDEPDSHSYKAMCTYDFTKERVLNLDIYQFIDAVNSFSKESYINIKFKKDNRDIKLDSERDNRDSNIEKEVLTYFCPERNLEVFITDVAQKYSSQKLYYRNQTIHISDGYRESYPSLKFLYCSVNILGGNAKDILSLNRNMIQEGSVQKLNKDIINTILLSLFHNYHKIKGNRFKQLASMFINYYSSPMQKQEQLINDKYSCWEEYNLCINNSDNKKEDIVISKIFERYNKIIITQVDYDSDDDDSYHTFNVKDANTFLAISDQYSKLLDDTLIDFINYMAIQKKFNFFTINYLDHSSQLTITKDYECDLITDLKSWIDKCYKKIHFARGLMPCLKEYIVLQLKDDYQPVGIYDRTFSGFESFQYPKMICPYVVMDSLLSVDVGDYLYDLVYQNRADKDVTKEQIIEAYKLFIKNTEAIVLEVNADTLKSKEKQNTSVQIECN